MPALRVQIRQVDADPCVRKAAVVALVKIAERGDAVAIAAVSARLELSRR